MQKPYRIAVAVLVAATVAMFVADVYVSTETLITFMWVRLTLLAAAVIVWLVGRVRASSG